MNNYNTTCLIILFGLSGSTFTNLTCSSFLSFFQPLLVKLLVCSFSFLALFASSHLQSLSTSLALKLHWSNQSLDLWCLRNSLSLFVFEFSANNIASNIIFFGKTEHSTDVVCSFWSQTFVHLGVCKSRDVVFSLANNY
mmetsp:Transcript_17429/g.54443  ORF Transcript_17429/g.54443 Transcript_17429/m.54443 type:complete len:139 (-) Transcript_17429:398-814(-)